MASAISAATRLEAAILAPGLMVPWHWPASVPLSARERPTHAIPLNVSAAATAAPTANSRTRKLMPTCSSSGTDDALGIRAASTGAAGAAMATPATPPAIASASPSVCRARSGRLATYYVPHHAHATMEPPVAMADFRDGKVTAWAPVQNPQAAQETVAAALGIDKSNVVCHVTLLGGGFGRKSKAGFRRGGGAPLEEGGAAGKGRVDARG
jgi:molybdopterin-binding aldehyde dehydrogenase-like protein